MKLDDGRATVLTYAHISAFKFPDMLNVHLRCTVEICRHGCPNHCSSQYGPPPGHKKGPISNDLGSLNGEHSLLEPIAHESQNTEKFASPNDLSSGNEKPREIHVQLSSTAQPPLHTLGEVLEPQPQPQPQLQPQPQPQHQPQSQPQQGPPPQPNGQLSLSLLPPLPPHPQQVFPTPGRPPHPQHIPPQLIQQRPGAPPQRLRSPFPPNMHKHQQPGMFRHPPKQGQNFPPRPFMKHRPGRPQPFPSQHQQQPPNRQGLPHQDEEGVNHEEHNGDQLPVVSEGQPVELLDPRNNDNGQEQDHDGDAANGDEESRKIEESHKEHESMMLMEPQAQPLKGMFSKC